MKTLGISRFGGKYRLVKKLLKRTPPHNFFQSLFCGACFYEINKPRATQYENFNDIDAELMNYLYVITEHTEEFDEYKNSIWGIPSQYIFNKVKEEDPSVDDDIKRAVLFFYINKVGFSGSNAFSGFNFQSTRPFTNNDGGLLTPLDREVIKRLHYVRFTQYHFKDAYKKFESFYHGRSLEDKCLVFCDPPYPGTESYYNYHFTKDEHYQLIEILLKTPFKFILTIGGECDFYLEELDEFTIEKVKIKYQTNSKHQYERDEWIIRNYDGLYQWHKSDDQGWFLNV